MNLPALFPKPTPDPPRLSQTFGSGDYRSGPNQTVRWTRKAPRTRSDCDECTALQHETAGAYWPRRQVRARRAANGTVLDLCSAHAAAWKHRDVLDGGPT